MENFGGRKLKAGVAKVRLTNLSPSIESSNQWISIPEIGVNESIEFSELLQFRIKDNVSPGARVAFNIELKSSGDEVDSEYRESITITKRVHVNPEVRVRVTGEEKTRWRKWSFWPFKWEYRRESLSVSLTGVNENVPGKYIVKLSQIKGPKVVNLDAPIKVGSPEFGRTKTASIGYQFNKKARKVTLRFLVSVWYDGELIKEKEISTFVK